VSTLETRDGFSSDWGQATGDEKRPDVWELASVYHWVTFRPRNCVPETVKADAVTAYLFTAKMAYIAAMGISVSERNCFINEAEVV
jgi:hypothetical protein